mmetsp:Transcript_18207/g.32557  ORF Transcript_18207/g.32557 Transcript_18207/m.32557 type:complete len:330 (-) Transcript_18207:152-1141(-)
MEWLRQGPFGTDAAHSSSSTKAESSSRQRQRTVATGGGVPYNPYSTHAPSMKISQGGITDDGEGDTRPHFNSVGASSDDHHHNCVDDDVENNIRRGGRVVAVANPQQRRRKTRSLGCICIDVIVNLSLVGIVALVMSGVSSPGSPGIHRMEGLTSSAKADDVIGNALLQESPQDVASVRSRRLEVDDTHDPGHAEGEAEIDNQIKGSTGQQEANMHNTNMSPPPEPIHDHHHPTVTTIPNKEDATDTQSLQDIILSFQDVTAEELKREVELQARERKKNEMNIANGIRSPNNHLHKEELKVHRQIELVKLETLLETLEMEAELLPSNHF